MASPRPFLLDTNVLVSLIRQDELGRRIAKSYGLTENLARAVISIVTVGDMYSLARNWNWGAAKIARLSQLLEEVVSIDISNEEILAAYGEIDNTLTKQGRRIGQNDVWIAATCKVADAVLLTMDRDFDPLDGVFIKRIWIDPRKKDPSG